MSRRNPDTFHKKELSCMREDQAENKQSDPQISQPRLSPVEATPDSNDRHSSGREESYATAKARQCPVFPYGGV
jgi:hypothetical protein